MAETRKGWRRLYFAPNFFALWQVCHSGACVMRAELDSQVGARICNGLGIMRACLETQKLEQLEARMDEIADRVARDRTTIGRERPGNGRERTSTHETHLS
jgi:hypothetical protein